MVENRNSTDENTLNKLRNEIDALDRELSLLLQKRLDLVSGVAEYKKRTKTQILDRNREERVIENVLSVVKKPEYTDCLRLTFEDIMAQSREFQKKRLSEQQQNSRRYALVGEHLSHSLSPAIHQLYFKKAGISATYELMEVPPQALGDLINRLKAENISGINITIPYKTEIMRSLDKMSDEALRVGAVNTVRLGEDALGSNTDYQGFGMALEYHGYSPCGKTCAVLGSGGASRAVVSYLEDHGAAQIAIVTRDTDGTGLKYPGLQSIDIKTFSAQGFDLVINATPVGMFPRIDASPISLEQLRGAGAVMDLIYNPSETLLMSYAKELCIPCANGLFMLVAQALCAEEIWQGKSIDRQTVIEIYKELSHS